MEIKWLKTFIVAAHHENFRKTAEELFLTQPAITKHIRRLEDVLQIQLFQRNGKHISLTPAGLQFLKHAQKIVLAYEEGMEGFKAWKQGYDQKLVIAAAPQIAGSMLPSLLRDFINQNPTIDVIINIVKSYEIGEEINAGRADVGLSRIKPMQANLNCKTLHEEPVVLVAPKNIEDAVPKLYEEKIMLQKYRLITHNHPDYWDALIDEIKRHYPNIQTMKVTQVEVTKRFIEEGLGISYLPYTVVKDELKKGKVVEVTPEKIQLPKSSTYLITKIKTREVDHFENFLTLFSSPHFHKRRDECKLDTDSVGVQTPTKWWYLG